MGKLIIRLLLSRDGVVVVEPRCARGFCLKRILQQLLKEPASM
jgi:hypothetical protein